MWTGKLAFGEGCGWDSCCSSMLSTGKDSRCNAGQLIRLSLLSSFACSCTSCRVRKNLSERHSSAHHPSSYTASRGSLSTCILAHAKMLPPAASINLHQPCFDCKDSPS